tara:strand:+ start:335 stop:751 length:417 start_codon:yes stop_codon:yes gene_type:complete
MKITRRQLINLINEATKPMRVVQGKYRDYRTRLPQNEADRLEEDIHKASLLYQEFRELEEARMRALAFVERAYQVGPLPSERDLAKTQDQINYLEAERQLINNKMMNITYAYDIQGDYSGKFYNYIDLLNKKHRRTNL